MPITSIQLTREELYDKVWSESLVTLGPKLGLSDVGLRKLCKRMLIPLPGLSYRAQKAAGRPATATPLPQLPLRTSYEGLRTVTVYPPETNAAGENVDPSATQRRFERDPANAIVVADRVIDPHPLIASSLRALRQAKTGRDGRLLVDLRRCVRMAVTTATSQRAMRIMDALIKACESRGWPVSIGPSPSYDTIIRVADEDLNVGMREYSQLAEGAKRSPGGWPPANEVASGKLGLHIARWLPHRRIRSQWGDSATRRLETLLNDYMFCHFFTAMRLRDQRLAVEEQQRRQEAEKQLRIDAYVLKQRPAALERALNHVVRRHQHVRQIRDYIESARAATPPADAALCEWLDWAEQYANSVDPLLPRPNVPEDPDPPKPPVWL